jgi:hypothetical protein
MTDAHVEGRLQVVAALNLIEASRLLRWETDAARFEPSSSETFGRDWKLVHPIFGRLICWMMFCSGAEYFAKGVCLVNKIDIRKPHTVPAYPEPGSDFAAWATAVRNASEGYRVPATKFGTLGDLLKKSGAASPLETLCRRSKAASDQEDLLVASYQLLASTIRNRDAHAYLPNVREDHHWLVGELFSKCLNLLVSWLPDGAAKLSIWRDQTSQVIAEYPSGPAF